MKFKVSVDRDMCVACGIAVSLCPEVFVLGDDNGKNRITDKYSQKLSENTSIGVVSEELHECVKQASEACPAQAISIEKINE